MVATKDNPLRTEVGDFTELPAQVDICYEGAAMGIDTDGYAGPLVAGQPFVGHCFGKVDNSAGSAGDKNVRIRIGRYRAEVSLVVNLDDRGQPVYMSDDETYTLDPQGTSGPNTWVGTVVRYVSATKALVEFDTSGVRNSVEVGDLGRCVFFDDFIGVDGFFKTETGSVGIWSVVDVADATEAVVADANGGQVALTIAATSEAEDAVLYFGNQLNFDVDLLELFRCRAKVATPGTGVRVVFGMAGDHNLDKDTVAQNAWFSLDGGLALKAESDDGATDNDDITISTITTDVWYDFEIDFRDKTDIKFSLNGVQVATGTTFTMANYTGGLQPYFSADKASGTGTATLTLDYVQVVCKRG